MSGCHPSEQAKCKHDHKFHVVCNDCYLTVIKGLERQNIIVDLFDVTIVPEPPETITIKKALWDEMLEYKKKVDILEKLMTQEIRNSYQFRLERLESKLGIAY